MSYICTGHLLHYRKSSLNAIFVSRKISCKENLALSESKPNRPGHSLGKNIKLHEMKNEKNYVGFLIYKNMANFEASL